MHKHLCIAKTSLAPGGVQMWAQLAPTLGKALEVAGNLTNVEVKSGVEKSLPLCLTLKY